jgi:hypothetical protein
MSEHTHDLTGVEMDKLLWKVWLSGFKSGVGTLVTNRFSGMPDELRSVVAGEVAQTLTMASFEDPAARETAKDAIRQTVEIHFHGDIPPTEAMILRIKVG